MNVLTCGPKASKISGISDAISPRYIRKNPRSTYARVPHMMAQFVLKMEKLYHIIGTAPILEMARAYGLLACIFENYFTKALEYFFHVYIASTKHSRGLGEFSKVMQTRDVVEGLHLLKLVSVSNFPNPPRV